MPRCPIHINESEIELTAVRSQGAGGQHVNKVATAIHCRFDILQSSLSDHYKQRLLQAKDSRINKQGIIIIKAQRFRTQLQNRQDAIKRLNQLICKAIQPRQKRIPTQPSKAAKQKLKEAKQRKGQLKAQRAKVHW